MNPSDYTRTAAALLVIPYLAEELEIQSISGTPETSGSSKPGSRTPAPISYTSDLEAAWNTLTTWVRDWQETIGTQGTVTPTWSGVCEFLSRHWPNMAEQHPAATDFADEIAGHGVLWGDERLSGDGRSWSVHRLLSRHTQQASSWQPIIGRWKCPVGEPPCNGKLLEHIEQRVIVCQTDNQHWWTQDMYEQLGKMLGMDYRLTTEQAAQVAKVSKRTIDRWIASGVLPLLPGEERIVDKRDLAVLAARRVTGA